MAIGTLVFAIIEGNEQGWTEPVVIGAFVVTAASFAAYAYLGLRTEHPLLDPALFGIRGFRAGAITVLVQFMAVFGFFFAGLQYLQLILGYSPLKAAVALVPVALAVLPTSMVTPHLVHRVGMKAVMSVGLFLLALGLYVISFLGVDSGYLPFLGGLILAGFGIGLSGAVGTAAITGSLGRGQQGVASAMNDTTREIGSAAESPSWARSTEATTGPPGPAPSTNFPPGPPSPYGTRQPPAFTSPISSAAGVRPSPTASRALSWTACPLP
ncbi:MFS transporter [Streptomyces sp. 7R007]